MATGLRDLVVKITGDDSGLSNALGHAAKAGRAFGVDIDGMISKYTGPGGWVSLLADVGKALFDLGLQYQEATAIIGKATAATGDDLEALTGSLRDVAASGVEQNLNEVAAGLGELNTRMGLTGDSLEEATLLFADFADVTGTDTKAAVASVSRVMQKWGVDTEDMPKLLDKLYVASAKSGLGVNQLTQSLTQNATQLSQVGLSLDDSIALLSAFELAGVNTSQVMAGLTFALSKFSTQGIDAADGFNATVEAIQNAENQTEATRIAVETFGRRAGPELAQALKEGRISIDDFKKALSESEGTLKKVDDATETVGDKWAKLGNKVGAMLEPVGSAFVDVASEVVDGLNHIGDTSWQIGVILRDALKNGTVAWNEQAQQIYNSIKDEGLKAEIKKLASEMAKPGEEFGKAFIKGSESANGAMAAVMRTKAAVLAGGGKLEKEAGKETVKIEGEISEATKAIWKEAAEFRKKLDQSYIEFKIDEFEKLREEAISYSQTGAEGAYSYERQWSEAIAEYKLKQLKVDYDLQIAEAKRLGVDQTTIKEIYAAQEKAINDQLQLDLTAARERELERMQKIEEAKLATVTRTYIAWQTIATAADANVAASMNYTFDQTIARLDELMGTSTLTAIQMDRIFSDLWQSIADGAANILQSGMLDVFNQIGVALVDTEQGFANVGEALLDLGEKILDMLPLLLLQAGLQAIAGGMWPLGLALIGASLIAATIGGIVDALKGSNQFAQGTQFAPGGMATINEAGPEYINLPRGAEVVPTDRTQAYGLGNGGNTFVFNSPTQLDPYSARVAMETETRRLAFLGAF